MRTLVLFLSLAMAALPKSVDQIGVTVHEWGTFTSVAGANGENVRWYTYQKSAELPCFVESFGGFKYALPATVRMETPVIYFYGSRDSTADVKVRLTKGTITDWYPKVTTNGGNYIQWNGVKVTPDTPVDFPKGSYSHYYKARETDAAPLRVGSQNEKFLFYRGVGDFPLPLSASLLEDGKVRVKNVGKDPVAGVILFENRDGQRRYAVAGAVGDEINLDLQSLQDNWAGLLSDLERVLIESGLYQREARAMIETWRDSWFEEGTRLFYIVPSAAIDSILPLEIRPAPASISRVFVGRMELITPSMIEEVRLGSRKYGRFLDAIAQRAGVKISVPKAAANSANCAN